MESDTRNFAGKSETDEKDIFASEPNNHFSINITGTG